MMQFDDDVEGTGMGEGEGKKDVTDQIEDEEQLLGLKGDEPDKDQAEEAKELGKRIISCGIYCTSPAWYGPCRSSGEWLLVCLPV